MREKTIRLAPHWTRGIRRWLDKGFDADREWYARANLFCKELGIRFETSAARVAAVLAALSPGTSWDRNKIETRALLEEWRGQRTPGTFPYTTYPANVKKARRILRASDRPCFLDLVKPRPASGWKIGSFYRNIVDPVDPDPVTIDRHAIAICLGHPPDEGEQQLTGYRYRCYAAAYRRVAAERGMVPSEVQAITWAAYRRHTGDLHQTELPF
jgi:hypothetical protein